MFPSFIELKKASKKENKDLKEYRLALLSNTSTQHITTAIKGYGNIEGINLQIYNAEYNQIEAQLLDENSELYQYRPQGILLLITPENLYKEFINVNNKKQFSVDYFSKLEAWWRKIDEKKNINILQSLIMEVDEGILGNYASKIETSFIYQLRKLNFLIMQAAVSKNNLYLLDTLIIQNKYGREQLYDSKLFYMGKLTFSMTGIPILAKYIVDIIKSFIGKTMKCMILDLDNTLWGGIISEDGIDNIEIGTLGRGQVFTDFQIWLKQLKNQGILLAICSKNDEKIAKEPFEKHPEMVLHLSDFSIFVANWEDKASNIKYIQETLNIGMDSIVFIDDNPFERELVKSVHQDICVPDMPTDPEDYLDFLKSLNLFETISFSCEDKNRTAQYQIEIKRKQLEKQYASYDEYLKSLHMIAKFNPFDSFHISRIAQLTQRSNQFNLRTVRCTEKEIENIMISPNEQGFYLELKDKFGKYGLVSVMTLKEIDYNKIFITNWIMSCRVLKRNVEAYMINEVVNWAKHKNYRQLIGEYVPTSKNSMVKKLYEQMGFIPLLESSSLKETTINESQTFILELDKYKDQMHYIKRRITNE